MTGSERQGSSIYWGLLRAQGAVIIASAILVATAGSTDKVLAALWGGGICLIANAWAGFQVWMHPGNRSPQRLQGAAIRAEVGKVVIVLLLFGLTLKRWPIMHTGSTALILLLAFREEAGRRHWRLTDAAGTVQQLRTFEKGIWIRTFNL